MWRELQLFVMAGAVGFVVDAGVLYLALAGGLGHYAGRVISFLCAAWVTWRLNRRFAFRAAAKMQSFVEWRRYLFAMSGGGFVNYSAYCAAIVLLPIGVWTPLLGVAIGSLAGLSVNFFLAGLWVFRRKHITAGLPDGDMNPAPGIPRLQSLVRRVRTVDLDAPVATDVAQVAVPLLFGVWSLCLGVDGNWDLYNYHLYNPFALLNGKLHADLAPAGFQTYLNPLLDIPYYVMSRHLPAPLIAFAVGAVHGLTFVLLLRIARKALAGLPEGDRNRVPLLLAVAGVLTANFLSELGNTMGDNATALFCLGSLLLVLTHWEGVTNRSRHSVSWILGAGLVMGLGVGLKLTNAIFAVALCAALLLMPGSLLARVGAAFLFGGGVLLGIAATGGFWLYEMWRTFGNPLFPQFGAIFPNPLALNVMVADDHWLPKGVAEVLLWPFLFSLDSHRVGQLSIRQIIWPIAYLVFIAWTVVGIARRARRRNAVALDPRAQLVVAFVIFGYLLWMGLFSIYRYLVSVELLAPLVVFMLLSCLFAYPTARRAAAWLLGIATTVVVAGGIQTWGHKGWSLMAFDAEVPEISRPSATTALIVGGDPAWAWLAVFFPPDVSFIQLGGNFPEGPGYGARVKEILSRGGGPAFAIFQGERHFRLENVLDANDYANRWGLTTTAAGCNVLRWTVSSLRLHAKVQDGSRSAPGALCELGLRPGDEKDLAAENRMQQDKAQSILATYGLALDPLGCTSHRGRIGQTVAVYQWCRVVRH